MARKGQAGLVGDLMGLMSRLPGWVGLVLAVVSYLVLHPVAEREMVIDGAMGRAGAQAAQVLGTTLAKIGQYALPLICLLGAGVSASRQGRRRKLVRDTRHNPELLNGISWREFEMMVGEAFRQLGYRVVETGGRSADGGVDLRLAKGPEKFLVQCKQWKAFKVGVGVVRELYGAMAAEGAAGGFVVTSGSFTADATRFASGRNLQLIDGSSLHDMLRGARKPQEAARPPDVVQLRPVAAVDVASAAASSPDCPTCAKSMIKRRAKRGANADREFWGCVDYPACRGTRHIG